MSEQPSERLQKKLLNARSPEDAIAVLASTLIEHLRAAETTQRKLIALQEERERSAA